MDAASVAFLEPSNLKGFQAGGSRDAQPPSIPRLFLDAMEVRGKVFVQEQKVPQENEFDSDDSRACHWIVYAKSNHTARPVVPNGCGNAVQPRQSSTRKTPVGTVRLVPFPHDPHPKAGGSYWNGALEGEQPASDNEDATAKPLLADRPTSFHDGQEPYVKLGRLAVVKECRGQRLAGLLVHAALSWLKANPSYFDEAVTEPGSEQETSAHLETPKWEGLVCAHAQEQAVGAWAKWGFHVDDAMGRWFEEGIPHIGMFQRLNIDQLP
ncbi:hypothetical protein G6O67_005892 [Ophiocordyceps sinensis]|uniref:Uncharacterized protein n=2 Tax=Ophiocordyceps sinensis TaxID=72228 RepID=A0A8H4LXY0_9HYPO|nr:Acyl-CoA N-acyltransferase [Ophiocordyceps sinensis CO18]KAF4507230.1 hypothetical protein G6O67_005892 [Ophiocordyceps sinensis]